MPPDENGGFLYEELVTPPSCEPWPEGVEPQPEVPLTAQQQAQAAQQAYEDEQAKRRDYWAAAGAS